MKKIYSKLFLFALAFVSVLAGCSDDDSLSHTNVTPVGSLYTPEDNAFFNLEAQSPAVFEWEAAKAEDNGVVLYEVVFDKEDGDFSNPIYKMPSDDNGFRRTLTLPYADLAKIAEIAGIEKGERGKLRWTVMSSKGFNVQPSPASRIIEVERPMTLTTPEELYIAGSATEGGEDLNQAMMMKKIGNDNFEIYTSLKPGEYFFASSNEDGAETYFEEEGKLKAEGAKVYDGEEKVYRIKVNFSNNSVEYTEIEAVDLWFAPTESFIHGLPYAGNGTWEVLAAPVEFKQEDWGRDERYKFRFTINNGSESSEQWYGSANNDNQRPGESEDLSYWYMVPVSNDRWNNSFKFADAVDNNTSDIRVIFNTSVPEYTHTVTPN